MKRLETSLEQCKPLRAAGVAANGLLAASRGDLEKARLLLATVEQVHPSARPAAAVRIAREWLSVDAAERGDWDLAARLGRLAGPRSRLTRLIGAVGSRLVRAPKAPGPLSIWALWALAPHRLVAFPWVRRALAPASPRSREKRVAVPFPTVAGLDALGAAVSTHAAVIERGASLPPAQLVRALKAWDRAFEDPGVMGRVQQRAAALAVPFPETVLFEMRRDVLAELMRASFRGVVPLRLLPEAGLGLEIADQLRQELLGAVERAVESLHRRLEEKGARPLPAGDELAEWLTLRAACERAGRLGGEELRRISFAIVQSEVCNHAVWLYNVRRETPVANVIMTWLLSEAEAVGDAEAVEFHRRNVQIGI